MNRETVRLEHLSIGYRSKRGTRTVAADISAALRGGELTCLLGPNGIGKSTLLRTLSAFQSPLEGNVYMAMADLAPRNLSELNDRERSRMISVVLTEKPDVAQMTADELVGLGRSPYTGFWGGLTAEDRVVVAESMALVGITHLAPRLVSTLSDGERQKVMIAKALAQQTPVIYLDEPTAFLDFPSKVEVMLLLRRICRETGRTVFLSTHDLELALQTADTIWLIDHDNTLVTGTPAELAAQGWLSRFVERPGISFDSQSLTIRIDKTTN